jgi:signal transduction histidine kinase
VSRSRNGTQNDRLTRTASSARRSAASPRHPTNAAIPASEGPAKRQTKTRDRNADAQREFLGLVSHELKNPLAAIKGMTQLLRRRRRYDEAALDAILSETRRLERLLNDLVDTSQVDAGRLMLRPAEMDLAALVVAAAADAQVMTARHTVRAEVPKSPVLGLWDAQRLGQVLQNLLGNALKYAPDGTLIVARLEPRVRKGEVCVRVVDEGPGVPPDELPHLFDRFYRTPAAQASVIQGLGLGLYISRMLVEAHGGRIWVEPAGCGTAFSFALPGLKA